MSVAQVMERSAEGLPKLWTVHKALLLRKEHPEWFGAEAEYVSVTAAGSGKDRVIAYRRGEQVLTVVPRWSHDAGAWGETSVEVPAGRWTNRLTGAEISGGRALVSELLKDFPVALLSRES